MGRHPHRYDGCNPDKYNKRFKKARRHAIRAKGKNQLRHGVQPEPHRRVEWFDFSWISW